MNLLQFLKNSFENLFFISRNIFIYIFIPIDHTTNAVQIQQKQNIDTD